jgi:hypothetical protein
MSRADHQPDRRRAVGRRSVRAATTAGVAGATLLTVGFGVAFAQVPAAASAPTDAGPAPAAPIAEQEPQVVAPPIGGQHARAAAPRPPSSSLRRHHIQPHTPAPAPVPPQAAPRPAPPHLTPHATSGGS